MDKKVFKCECGNVINIIHYQKQATCKKCKTEFNINWSKGVNQKLTFIVRVKV